MKKQRSARTFDPSAHFPNGTAAQLPPEHTVSRGSTERPNAAVFDENQLENIVDFPLPLTRELLDRGRERFTIYCAVCHGEDGYGKGIVQRRGFPSPPSFHDERLRAANIGHFVNVMTNGYGVMYSYRDRVTESDRWAIAAYIRALQRSQHASVADVPVNEVAQLQNQ